MRRALVVLAAGLALVGAASAAPAPEVVRVAKPAFPPPLARVTPSGRPRLELVSTTPREPTYTPVELEVFDLERRPPTSLQGEPIVLTVAQPGTRFIVYGTGLIAGFGPRGAMKYAFDLRSLGSPPRSLVPRAYGPQEVVWARQLGGLMIVQTSHLGYASDSGDRNGYLTAIDLDTGKVRWRSPSLVANARNFVVVKGMIVSGYGFTAERDWLYLTDARTGRVRDRLALPSMAERISLDGDRLVVRCYDALVVAHLVPA